MGKRSTKSHQPRRKPTVAIIGAGRLGQALAIALNSSGYRVKALVARRRSKAEKAAGLIASGGRSAVALGANDLAQLPPVDLILIATPDDAIEATAKRLSELDLSTKVVLHTSGALSSSVLTSLSTQGIHTGSLHPLVSVSEPRAGSKALRGSFYCVEGDASAARVARAIVRDLEGKSFAIASENKALYHAAALTAAGHLTALIDLAIEMLGACGLTRKRAQEVLMPLIESAVNNLKTAAPEKVLTGTFARGDLATVKRHLDALGDQDSALHTYKVLGLRSLQLAEKAGLDSRRAGEIENLLSDEKRSTK